MVHSSATKYGVGGISAINRYYGRDHLEIGAYKGPIGRVRKNHQSPWGFMRDPPLPPWEEGPYAKDLVDTFPGARIIDATQAPSSLSVLRKQLAEAAPNSVKIVAVGYAINILELLLSKGDQRSNLDGVELVKSKVSELIFMGGRRGYPDNRWLDEYELEEQWNFCGSTDLNDVCGGKGAGCGNQSNLGQITYDALNLWPKEQVPITYLNFETGVDIWTGGVLNTANLLDTSPWLDASPCSRAYHSFCNTNKGWCLDDGNRQSWDSQAVLYAVRGTEGLYDVEPGSIKVNPETCGSEWNPSEAGDAGDTPQEFSLVLPGRSYEIVEKHIDDLLLQERLWKPSPLPPPSPPSPPPWSPPPPLPPPFPPPPPMLLVFNLPQLMLVVSLPPIILCILRIVYAYLRKLRGITSSAATYSRQLAMHPK